MSNNASNKKDRGFLYKISRKIRYLKQRGTLFHKTPKKIRHKAHLRNLRAWRHAFFFLRPAVIHRLRRLENFKAQFVKDGPLGYESFSGRKIEVVAPVRPKKKYTSREKFFRFFRKMRYLRKKRKLFLELRKKSKKRGFKRIIRLLFYLIRTGKIFKVDWAAIMEFLNRNYSFLGKTRFFIIFLNSLGIYMLAYIFIFLSKSVATALVANTYQIQTIVMYYDVNFLIRSGDWTPDMIQVVFSAGPFVAFFLCLISLVIYANTTHQSWPVRMFVFWVMCHSFVQFFGELLLGSLLSKGFGWTIAYMFYLDTPKMVIALIGFIALVAAGLGLTRFSLYSGNIYFNKLNKKNRMPFILSQVFLPFIIGTIFIIALKQPRITSLEVLVAISMIFLIFPAVVRARFFGNMYFDEEPRQIKLMWPWLLAAILLIPAFRLIFGIGVRI